MPRWNPLQPPENGLPPEEVRFTEVRVEPWPEDSHKVRVHLQITPFIKRPNIEVTIKNQGGEEVASIYIVESIDDRMAFTMHLRDHAAGQEQYTLLAVLIYPESAITAQETVIFQTLLSEND